MVSGVMDNTQTARRWFEGVWNQRNPEVIRELMDPAAEGVSESGPVRGPEEFQRMVHGPMLSAFPDFHVELENVIGQGDEVAVRWTATATHRGAFGPLPASGRRVRFFGMTWLRFRGGRIVWGRDSFNLNGLVNCLAEGAECATVRLADA